MRGEVRPLDVMECCGRYAINICSVGIDARIGTEVHQYHDSYVLSAVANLFKGIAQPLTVRGCGMEYSGGTSLICACNGRFYGGGFKMLGVQALGVAAVIAWVGVTMTVVFQVIKRTIGLRVPKNEETAGLDIIEHGLTSSYADFMPAENEAAAAVPVLSLIHI